MIAAGRTADLVVVAGNPAADIRETRDVRWVVRDGAPLPIDTLLELAPSRAGERPAKAAAPAAPAPDPSRVALGTVVYDVLMNGRSTGVNTVRLVSAGDALTFTQRTHTGMMRINANVRLDAVTLAPDRIDVVQEMSGNTIRIQLGVHNARMIGELIMPEAFGGTTAIDTEFPAGSYDATALAQILATLPLEAGIVWMLPVYNSFARTVVPYSIEAAGVEAVDVGGTPVPAFRIEVETSGFRRTIWISEAIPRWVVASEIPAFELRNVARSRPR